MHLRIQGFLLLWITVVILSNALFAEESVGTKIDQADVSLQHFVSIAVETNLRVKAARMALLSNQAMRDANSQPLFNPDFTISAESSDDLNGTVGISQQFDWNGKRAARSQVADADLLYAKAEFKAFHQAFLADLLDSLAHYQISRKRYALVTERQKLMTNLVARAQSRFEAGDISQIELDLVKLAAINVRIKSATVKAKQLQARKDVRLLATQTDSAQWPDLPDEIPDIPTDIDPNSLLHQIPQVTMARLSVETNESLIELRRKERLPDPTVSLVGGQEDDDMLIGLNIKIPLFVRNSFKYEVEAVLADRNESQLIADDVQYRALVMIENSQESFRTLRSAWVDWQSTSEESLSRPLDQLQRLWETGELSTADYVVQLSQTLEVRESALDLNESLWQAWFRWLLASGQIGVWLGVES